MKVISFLGITNYSTTRYVWDGREKETEFFPEAVAHFVKPEKILICLTPTAREGEKSKNWHRLKERLEREGIPYEPLPIPEGHSEPELWEIFDVLTTAVQENEQVIFDITNSFRSLPFLSFLAIAYLKAAKNVDVKGVLYGAWDARNEENKSPVFDLTPFVSLLDWTNATNRFVETGDGRALAKLLTAGMPTGPQMGRDLELRALGANMRLAAQAIQTVSLALQVTRPMEVMESSAHLVETLDLALPVFAQRARPFSVLAESIAQEYGQFELEDAPEPVNFSDGLQRQLRMIEWYLKREQVVQAATLMREWIVSLLAYHFDAPMFELKQGRDMVEKALNNGVERRKASPRILESGPFDEQFEHLPKAESLSSLWSKVTDLRNDIAHVGMRQNPKTASQLKQKIEAIFPQLELLADEFLPNIQ